MTSKDLQDFLSSDVPMEQKFLIGLPKKPFSTDELEETYSKVSLLPNTELLKNPILKKKMFDINKN